MTASDRLRWAHRLLDRPDAVTAGVWPRAASLLARQALEDLLEEFWALTSPPMCHSRNVRAKVLALHGYPHVAPVASRVNAAWAALSRGCHHHPYELPPTRDELLGWMEVVAEFRAAVARAASRR
jgi:hypothetical protein